MGKDPKVIIADNQDITRAGLHFYIASTFNGCDVVDVYCKKELIKAMDNCGAGIVIIDYTLFDFQSIEDLQIIQKRFPYFHWILFSSELSVDFIRRASAEDNFSIILKDSSREYIKSALIEAYEGKRFISNQIENLLNENYSKENRSNELESTPLTATEIEILKLIAQGKSVKEMAAERFSSTHTIITHKKNIFRKIGVNNVHEATRYALRAGLIEIVEYFI